jgi:hypothetical protein
MEGWRDGWKNGGMEEWKEGGEARKEGEKEWERARGLTLRALGAYREVGSFQPPTTRIWFDELRRRGKRATDE